MSDIDIVFKIIILGDTGVGKTSILEKYVDHVFSDIHISTIGIDFYVKTIEYNNKKYKLQMWDTAGQEKFSNLIRSYFKNCSVAIVVYDMSDYDSFLKIESWIENFQKHTIDYRPIIIVGNKMDINNKKRRITKEMEEELIKKYDTQIIPCSAKTGDNIDYLFEKIVEKIDTLLRSGKLKENEFNGIRINNNKYKINMFDIDEQNNNLDRQKACCTIL